MTDWQKIAEQRAVELAEAKKELADYVESSGLLEQELEEEVKQLQKKLKEEKTKAQKLEQERDTLKSKASEASNLSRSDLTRMQTELAQMKATVTEQTTKMRDLEQKNDQFEEAAHRATALVEGLESQVNTRIEESAFLRTDLEEHAAVIQHLKEELRDAKSELDMLRSRPAEAVAAALSSSVSSSPVRPVSGEDVPVSAAKRVAPATAATATQTEWESAASTTPALAPAVVAHEPMSAPAATATLRVPPTAAASGLSPALASAFATPVRTLAMSKAGLSPLVGRSTPSRAAALTMVSELLQRISSLETKLVSCHATTSKLNTSTSARVGAAS